MAILVQHPHGVGAVKISETRTGNSSTRSDGDPEIISVSPVFPLAKQKIVVQGRGLGLHTAYAHTDSPYLAFRDLTSHWAAGRIIAQNWDEVMLDVEIWTDKEIIVSGFSGEYGQHGWNLAPGDQLEIAVWNPQTGSGPALFHVQVLSAVNP
jgi:hypothetical protein